MIRHRRFWLAVSTSLIVTTGFQNCGPAFQSAECKGESCETLASSSLPSPVPTTVPTPAPPPSLVYDGLIETLKEPTALFTPAVSDLQSYLHRMTGADFNLVVGPVPQTSRAIHLSLISLVVNPPAGVVAQLNGQGLEAFVIVGNPGNLYIFANDERGLAHGVYYYLEGLGVRWLMPGNNWTVVPPREDITLTINRFMKPAFDLNRSYAGTGGFFSNLFGRLYADSAQFGVESTAWQHRLRFGYEYHLGHATGESFVTLHAAAYPDANPSRPGDHTLQEHPEYLAKIDGGNSPLYIPSLISNTGAYLWDPSTKRYILADPRDTAHPGTHNLNIIAKLNAGNPDAVNLYCDWIIASYRAVQKTKQGYAQNTISVEPSDGGGYGNNTAELRAAGVGDGSGSDQTYFIANQCAKKLRAEYPDAFVILLAYAGHADPPSFALESNVLIQPAADAFRSGSKTSGLTPDQFLKLWATKVSTPLSNYTYWSIPDWTHDEPTFNYLNAQSLLKNLYDERVRGFHAESTYSAGAMGIGHYLASHLMWDINSNQQALLDDWYENAFGPAKVPMIRMLERWAHNYRPISNELAASYADINEAERLAGSNAAVTARVDDYARYLHYLRLRVELANAEVGAQRNLKASELAKFIFDISDSRMVQTTRAFDLLAFRGFPTLRDEFHLHDPNPKVPANPPNGPGWTNVHSLSHSEVAALIADGKRKYSPSRFTIKMYTGRLVPLKTISWKTPIGDPWGTIVGSAGVLDGELEMPPGLSAFPLRVSKLVNNTVTITDSFGKTVFTHDVLADTNGAVQDKLHSWAELRIPLAKGNYHVHFYAAGGRSGYFNFVTWKGVPFTFTSFLAPKGLTKAPQLYFYVPPGQQRVVLYLPDGLGRYLKLFDSHGTAVSVELMDGNRVVMATVPVGEVGKVWSMSGLMSPDWPLEMLTTPQTFSVSPEILMVPSDAL